jgi:hypothetical protein
MTGRSDHLTSLFATRASRPGPPMRGFLDARPDGRRKVSPYTRPVEHQHRSEMILFTASGLPFRIAFHTTIEFFTEEIAARAPAMRGFLDAGRDGRRAFRNRYVRRGMPGLSVFLILAGGVVPRRPAVCRGTPWRRHRRPGGGILGNPGMSRLAGGLRKVGVVFRRR